MDFNTYAEATSHLASEDGRYKVGNLSNDSGRSVAWAEGVEGHGIGESVSLYQYCYHGFNGEVVQYEGEDNYNPDGSIPYTEICVVNGYAKNQQTWEENGRVKRLLMLVEGKPFAYLELEDTIKPQYFTLPEQAIVVPNGIVLQCDFVIEEVYPGTKYEDTCLTGLVMEFRHSKGH